MAGSGSGAVAGIEPRSMSTRSTIDSPCARFRLIGFELVWAAPQRGTGAAPAGPFKAQPGRPGFPVPRPSAGLVQSQG